MKKIGGENRGVGHSVLGAFMVYLLILSNVAIASGDTYLDNNFSIVEQNLSGLLCESFEVENCYNETIVSCENVSVEELIDECHFVEKEICENVSGEDVCEIVENEVCEEILINHNVEECVSEEIVSCDYEIVEECVELNNEEENLSEEAIFNESIENNLTYEFELNESIDFVLENESLEEFGLGNIVLDEDSFRFDLVQGDAVVGENVKWIKRVYTNNSNIEVEIPDGAIKISENFYSVENANNERSGFSIQSLDEAIEEDMGEPYLEVEYETSPPMIEEENLENGKKVLIWSEEHYENVSAFTELDESLNIVREDGIRINWIEEEIEIDSWNLEDRDENGIYDYVSWVVPHLSNQTFEIIVITNAEHLDSERNFISDIYEDVKSLDDVWSPTISENEYVRVVFEKGLDSSRDITVYSKTIEGNLSVEVYEKDGDEIVAKFDNLSDGKNVVYLENLVGIQDVFDLKIIGGKVQFDYIVDPIWYDLSWGNRKKITVTSDKINSDLENFPMLVELYDSDLKDAVRTDANDVLFTGSDMLTKLSHEVELFDNEYNSTHAHLIAWVKVNLSATTDNEFFYYYNNSGAANQEDSTNVWSSEHISVWHMNEIDIIDSTQNAINGISTNMNSGNVVSGKVGSAISFSESSATYIETADAPFDLTDDFTISAWMSTTDTGGDWARVIDKVGRWSTGYGIGGKSGAGYGFVAYWSTGWGGDPAAALGSVSTGEWNFVTSVVENGVVYTYTNGILTSTYSANQGNLITTNDFLLTLGKSSNQAVYWTGYLDEVRIMNTPKSADWISATYSNLNSPSDFFSTSSLELSDSVYPVVSFEAGTLESGVILNDNWIYVNVSVIEPNEVNITFNLYVEEILYDSVTYENNQREINWTNLNQGNYSYDVLVCDSWSNCNSTERRYIILDYDNPIASLISPESNSRSNNQIQNLTVEVEDSVGLKEVVLNIFNSSGNLINTTNVLVSGLTATVGILYDFIFEGAYSWFYRVFDSAGNYYDTENRTFILDMTSPEVFSQSINNNSGILTGDVSFMYNVTDELSEIVNCSLILNDEVVLTSGSILKNSLQEFVYFDLARGSYNFSIGCFDEADNYATSEKKYFDVFSMNSFSGERTNLSNVDLSSVPNFVLENLNYGKIVYNENVDLRGGLDFDSLIVFSRGSLIVDSDSQSSLNRSATIELYDLSYEFVPTILKNGIVCQDCEFNSYENGTFSFNVSSFSNYTLVDNSFLKIFDDTEFSGKSIDEDIVFYANYSDTETGQGILNAECSIDFIDGNFPMTYNSSSGFYEYEKSFSFYGVFDYVVECVGSGLGYENIISSNSLAIGFASKEFYGNGYRSQSGVHNMIGLDEFIPLDFSVVNLSSAFIIAPNLMNQENTTAGTSGDPATNSDDSFVSLYLYNKTHIRAQRYAADDGPVVVTWQVLEAMDGEFSVQRGEKSFSGTAQSITDVIPNPVNPANSMSWFYIRTDYSSNRADVNQFYSNIIDSNTIGFTRDSSTVSTSNVFRWEVVEWNLDKINNFAKGYTGSITGDSTSPDCFSIGKTINKSSSILFHHSHSTHTGTGGLDSATRAGYIQDDTTVCFYDFDGIYTAGVKWFLIDFGDSIYREENINTDWASADYRDDVSFLNTYNENASLFWLSGTSNGDTVAMPRHSQWWEFDSDGFYVERTYGGQNREYAWEILELPSYENVDAPIFSNFSVNPIYAKSSETIRFNLTIEDETHNINWTKGIVGELERNFIKGVGNEWYYDYVCQGNEIVPLAFVFAEDDSEAPRINYTYISGVNAICDSIDPVVSFVSPNTPENLENVVGDFFRVTVFIEEDNFENISFNLYNLTNLIESKNYDYYLNEITFSDLLSGVYYYNVTVYDKVGNLGHSETRSVIFDSDAPFIDYGEGVLLSGEFSSENQIFVNVTIEDDNFQNVTFYLYDDLMNEFRIPVTYTDSKRSLTWSLLSDGFYYYQVVAYDSFGNSNSTELRNVTIDTEIPDVSFTLNTKENNYYDNGDLIFAEVSLYDVNYKNLTFSLFDSSHNLLDEETFSDSSRSFSWNGLVDGRYYYNVSVYDFAGNLGNTETRSIVLDNINPVVNFGIGTENNLSVLNNDFIYVNVSYEELNFKNITFELYDSSNVKLQSVNFSESVTSYSFLNLDSETYMYKVVVYDRSGNFGETELRTISLDTLPPVINIIEPRPIAYGVETGLLLNFTAQDYLSSVDSCWWNIDDGANSSIDCSLGTIFDTSNGQHEINVFANDTFGYIGKSSVSFLISTGGPAIVLSDPINDTFYSSPTEVQFGYFVTDVQGVDSCSLYGSWNGGWHLNQTDFSFGLIGDDTVRTCSDTWPGLDCGASPASAEGDNTWDDCPTQGTVADESIEEMWVSGTEFVPGQSIEVTCYIDPYGTSNEVYMWYYNGVSWRTIYEGQAPGAANYNLTQSFTVDDVIGEHWVRCGIGYDADDVSDFCVNAGSYFDNDDVNFWVVEPKTEGNFSVPISDEEKYDWNINCNDTLGLRETALNNYSFYLDMTSPVVSFGSGSWGDGERIGMSNIYVDANVVEENFANITFELYDDLENFILRKVYYDETRNHTFLGLSSGIYYYNITVYDKVGHSGNSETRMVEVDVTKPTGNLVSPIDGTFTKNKTWNFTATVSDLVELSDATLFIYNSTGGLVFSHLFGLTGLTLATVGALYTFNYDDVFTWFFGVRDSVGNEYNTTEYDIEIDSTSPEVYFIPNTEESGSVVLQDWIFVNTSIYEKNYKNVTFWLYNSAGLLFQNSFSNNVRQINWTLLPDGIYNYNVTSYDLADNLGFSETREIILDDTSPFVSFTQETSYNNSVISGSNIFVGVNVIEDNEKNITFSLYDSNKNLFRTNTFTDGRRSINWTLIPEGKYYYNVTVYDNVGLYGYTQTREVMLDNTYPVINYGEGVEENNANKSQNWIFVNTTIVEENFKNVTFSLMNNLGQRIQNRTFTELRESFNFTGLTNGVYYYDVIVYDKGGFFATLPSRKITLDTISPVVSFVSPTENDYIVRDRDWIFVNVSVFDLNFRGLRFELRDNFNILIDSAEFFDNTRSYNFTNLEDNNYRYNVVAYDWANNTGSSNIRNIGLDLAGPVVNIIKPESKIYGYNESLPLEHYVYDKVSSVHSCWWNIDNGINNSIDCGVATNFNTSVDNHIINFYANDTFGRVGHDSKSFSISITGPAVELISPQNNTFYSNSTNILFNFTAEDPDSLGMCSLYGDFDGEFSSIDSIDYSEWYHVDWKKRKSIIVPASNIDSDLVDFPMLVELYDSDLKIFALSDGGDILFSSNGNVKLSHEFESYDQNYNSTHARLLVWVKVNLSSTNDNVFYLYYNNSGIFSQENPQGVWDSNFVMVQHLSETIGTHYDSSLYSNDGLASGLTAQGTGVGIVGGADIFANSASSYVEVPSSSSIDLTGSFTIEAWVNLTNIGTGYPRILSKQAVTAGTGAGYELIYNSADGLLRYCGGGACVNANTGTTLSVNQMKYVSVANNGTHITFYLDGVHSGTFARPSPTSTVTNFRIGNAVAGSRPLIGVVDEVRVSNVVRNSGWIDATYYNLNSPSNFFSIGEREELSYDFNFIVSYEGSYLWNVKCNDTIGYDSFALNNYTFIVDVTNPQVFFGAGTMPNDSITGVNWIYVNANVIENNFKNITFDLHDSSYNKIRTSSFADETRSFNFTGLSQGTYYYNITVYDKAERSGFTNTRKINLDLSPPSASLNSPTNRSYVRSLVQNLTASFSDSSGLLNATLYVLNQAGDLIYSEVISLGNALSATVGIMYNFVSEGIYSWFYGVTDLVGNEFNTTSHILTVDTTNPTISYGIGTEESGGIFERETIFVNVSADDLYFANMTFDFYSSSGLAFTHTFTDGTSQITSPIFPDGIYYYNVTAQDFAGNKNSTETRNITFDNLNPVISYGTLTKPNGAFVSGDSVLVSVLVTEPNEENITFRLYNEFWEEIRSNTYVDGRRNVNWNLLSEGIYYYNVTIYDKVGHFAHTNTRQIIIDDTLPLVTYNSNTENDGEVLARDSIFVGLNVVESNFNNLTISLYDSEHSLLDNRFFTDTTRSYNWTGYLDGVYYYNATVYDKAGNKGVAATRSIILDNVAPIIEFGLGTQSDGHVKTSDWIFVDAIIEETNFKNISFNLFDVSGQLIDVEVFSDGTRDYNFTNLESKIYYYNVSVYDLAGNYNSTETRSMGIDYLGPFIQIVNPKARAYGYNLSLPLEYNVIDAISDLNSCWYNLDMGANVTVDCESSTTFDTSDGQHVLHFYSLDSLGNLGYRNVTFLVSTTGPAIQLTNPEDKIFYSEATEVLFGYTAEDPDLTQSCSLYGSWNGGWHLNQTDFDWIIGETANFNENFEGYQADTTTAFNLNWTNSISDQCQWGSDKGGTTSASTGPSVDVTIGSAAGIYAYLESSTSGTNACATVGNEAHLVSDELDADLNNYNISFWYHMYGATMGSLHLDVYHNGAWQNSVWSASGNLGDTWFNQVVDLSDYEGKITLRLRGIRGTSYTSDMAIDEISIISTPGGNKESGNFVLNISEEGTHKWNVECNDTNGYYTWAVSNYSITVDVTDPIVDFGIGTLNDDASVSQNYVYVNSSVVENNFKNITFYLMNESNSTINVKTFNDTTRSYNFTNLLDGIYYYNLSVYDNANRQGVSSVRKIMLDTKAPEAELVSPQNNLISNNKTQNLTGTFSDENGLLEVVLYVFNQSGYVYSQVVGLGGALSSNVGILYTFLLDGIYSWFYQAEDMIGNKQNSTENTIVIDTTLPLVDFVNTTLENEKYISSNFIYANTSVVETNFANITFYLYNNNGIVSPSPNTFSNSKRDVNWTNLLDGEYYYNVTVWDLASNYNSSETRKIILDNVLPSVSYSLGTQINNANVSQNYVFVNTSIYDVNFDNVTYTLFNEVGVVNTTTYYEEVESINWTNLLDGKYYYNVTVYDKAGLTRSLPNRIINLDSKAPLVNFVLPTSPSGTIDERDWIYLEATTDEVNFKEIRYRLYNESGLINETIFTSPIMNINFTESSENKTYWYNATVYDWAGNFGSTNTRNISLIDVTNPSLIIESPRNMNYSYSDGIRVSYVAYDVHLDSCWYNLNDGANISLPNCMDTSINVVDEMEHTLNLYVNDTMGYMNSSSVSFFVNSSAILTPTYSVIRGESFVDGYVEESVDQIDMSKSFILHSVRGSDNGPDSLNVISRFLDVNTIVFENYDSGEPVVSEWALVVGPEIKTQRGEINFGSEKVIETSINSVNLSNSFIIVNSRINSGNSNNNVDGFFNAEFLDDSTIRFSRGLNGSSGELSFQVVSWAGVNVKSGNFTLRDGETFGVDLISSFDLEKSILIFSNNLEGGINGRDVSIRGSFVDDSNLNFSRVGNLGDAEISYFILESDLFLVENGNYNHLLNSNSQDISLSSELINESRAFSVNSYDSVASGTQYSTVFVTDKIKNSQTISLQKGSGAGAGMSTWFGVEINDLNNPDVILLNPLDSQNYSTRFISEFSFEYSDESQLANCSLYGSWNGGWHVNQTIYSEVSFSGINLNESGFYDWAVVCYDIYGNFNMTENRTFSSFLPPTEPVLVNITQTTNDGTGDVTLDWEDSDEAVSYYIYSGENANDLTFMTEVSESNYVDTEFAGEKRKFYRVEAWNPSSTNISSEIFGAHVYSLSHNSAVSTNVKNRNWIGFPTNFSYIETASDVRDENSGIVSVNRFDENNQRRVTCNEFSCPESFACTDTNCDFDILPGRGYEINLDTDGASDVNWSGVGIVYSPQDLTLFFDETLTRQNKNWISVSAYTTLATGRDLYNSIGVADSLTDWNSSTQSSQGLIPSPFPWIPSPMGRNFNIEIEKAYEVSVIEDTIWRQE